MRRIKLSVKSLFLLSLLFSGSAQARAADGCALRIQVVDPEGRHISAQAELLDSGAGVVTDEGDSLCVRIDTAQTMVSLVVTADGYQPHATDPFEVTGATEREVVVTLRRPFSETLTVQGRARSLVGSADSASSGVVGATELASRPLVRASDIIEAVPGVAITQHSSGGHAPIILLRGYNLDHGTDFATSVDGAPMNLPSHAHAHGYTDTNFLIEELVSRIEFHKGPYSVRTGNFGTAGAANLELIDSVDEPFARLEAGGNAFLRVFAVTSVERQGHRFLVAGETSRDDGPSEVPDDFQRFKGVFRYSSEAAGRRRSVTLASYGASWNATDGYPQRALDLGYLSRYGTLDSSDGGRTQQHLLIASRRATSDRALLDLGAYVRYYDLDLFSNLTFWTVSADLGDQIWQSDRRVSTGGHATYSHFFNSRAGSVEVNAGVQTRHDVARVRLRNTRDRTTVDKTNDAGQFVPGEVYDNRITETVVSPFIDTRLQPTSWVRVGGGIRADVVRMRVASDRSENSGTRYSAIASPKGSIAFGPWRGTEFYVNGGLGFHSNHAAGVMQRVDPATGSVVRFDGSAVRSSPPLVRTTGAEAGVRVMNSHRLQSSLAVWIIDSDSELLYTAEDGITSPERPGRRYGAEWLNVVQLRRWLTVDLDAAWSSARYRTDPSSEGRLIPDAASAVIGTGVGVSTNRVAASLRGRYVGRRPLLPSGSAFVEGAFTVNGQAEFRVSRRVRVAVQAFNLLNRHYEDTAYYYATRLRDPRTGALEPTASADYVTHPGQPRTLRAGLRLGL